jgi:hypothetical protein
MRRVTLSDSTLEFVAARGGVVTISNRVYLVG